MAGGPEGVHTPTPNEILQARERLSPQISAELGKDIHVGRQIADTLGDEVRAEYEGKRTAAVGVATETVHGTEVGKEALRTDTEFVKLLQEKFGDVEIKAEVLGGVSQEEAFKTFIDFMINLPSGEKEQLQTLFSDEDFTGKIKRHFKNNGFPNKQTYPQFKEDFSLKIEESQDIQETENISNEILKKYSKMKEMLSRAASISPESQELLTIISKYDNETDPEKLIRMGEEIHNYLGEGPDSNLWKILEAFKKLDEQNLAAGKKTEYYSEFSTSIAAADPKFAAQIQLFETNYEVKTAAAPTNIDTARIQSGFPAGTIPQVDGNIATAPDGKGNTISVDMGSNPPERFISPEGEEYKLKTELPVDTMYGATVKLETARNTLKPKIATLSSMIDYINKIPSGKPVQEATKEILAGLSYSFKSNNRDIVAALEGAKSIDDLKTLGNTGILANKKQEYETELKKAEETYNRDLEAAQTSYREHQEAKDAKTKEVLSFLKTIGFTGIPQSITDQIIALINRNPKAYGFDVAIDLANGSIGMDKTVHGDMTAADKKAFAEVFNTMLGVKDGQGNPPINIANLIAGQAAIGPNFGDLVAASGITEVGGVQKALDRIKQSGGEPQAETKKI